MGGTFAPYLNVDSGRVWISTDGGSSWKLVTHLAHNSPGTAFVRHRVNLSRYVGSSVRIKFDFDTFNAAANAQEGWFIDNISVAPMTGGSPALQVSPLSLAFAAAGRRVGVYDTNEATLARIAGGEMPFLEAGAQELLVELLPTGRLEFGSDAAMITRTGSSSSGRPSTSSSARR